jgi:hypothetical protein
VIQPGETKVDDDAAAMKVVCCVVFEFDLTASHQLTKQDVRFSSFSRSPHNLMSAIPDSVTQTVKNGKYRDEAAFVRAHSAGGSLSVRLAGSDTLSEGGAMQR